MPRHNFAPPRGRLETIAVESEALRGNLLGDPTERTVAVYLPEGYDEATTDYPLFVGLAGFTSSGLKLLAWQTFGENLPQRIDRLVAEGKMGPAIVAFPDCFTSLGGNQYVDSPVMGDWERFLLDEMIPELERRFRIRGGAPQRAVFGRSSGGYGALVQALRHGDRWGAVACHSGDIGFDLAFRRDLPKAVSALAAYDGDVVRFVEQFHRSLKVKGDEMYALMLLALSASYDPAPGASLGIRLPVDLHTCELIEERWDNWLAHDPLRMVEDQTCLARLRGLGGLWIDCGSRDEYFLHFGARSFCRRLEASGISHVFEEFDDGHSGIDYRLDRSLPFLYEAVCR